MTALTNEELQAARALCEKASPGPWSIWDSNSFRRITADGGRDGGVLSAIVCRDGHPDLAGQNRDRDLAFIAASRTLVPRLLEEVQRLRFDEATMKLSRMMGLGDPVRPDIHARTVLQRDTLQAERDHANRELARVQKERDELRERAAEAVAFCKDKILTANIDERYQLGEMRAACAILQILDGEQPIGAETKEPPP